jgi:hypothetical protein
MVTGLLHGASHIDAHPKLLATLVPSVITPRPTPPPLDWLRITQAIRRGARLSLQAERPGCTVSIHFHEALPFGRLRHSEPDAISNAIGCAKHCSRSHDSVIRVCDDAGNVIGTHEDKADFKD